MSCVFRAVVWDFFGTLTQAVRRGPAHVRIAHRLGCDPAELCRVLDATFHARSVGAYGDPARALTTVARMAGGNPDPATVRRTLVARTAAIRADTRLRPEAVPVLDTLRRLAIATAVVSDCGPELPEFFPRLPIAPLVDVAVFSIGIGRRKPDPMMYLTACERLGVAPDECLYIGDGGSRELTGASAVGMTAIRLAAPDLGNHLVFDADHDWCGESIGSLTEVLARRAYQGSVER